MGGNYKMIKHYCDKCEKQIEAKDGISVMIRIGASEYCKLFCADCLKEVLGYHDFKNYIENLKVNKE